MRPTWIFLLLAAALLTSGCGDLLSLHPLYSEQDKVFDTAYEGRWENKDEFLTVRRAGDHYDVTLKSKLNPSSPAEYEVHFVEIAGVRFADILPVDFIGHMFLRVRISDGQLRFAFFDSEWLRERIPHEKSVIAQGKTQAVLTARTPELRNLIAKYGADPKAYDEETVLGRVK
jgi:hypothetical protein